MRPALHAGGLRILIGMPDSATGGFGGRSKDPDFFKVVLASGVVVLVFFAAALLILLVAGRDLIPQKPRPTNPHASLVVPAPPPPAIPLQASRAA